MKLFKSITTIAVAITALTAIAGSASFAQDKMDSKMSTNHSAMSSGKMSAKESAIQVTTGKFHKVAHNTKGVATISENPDGSRELKLSGFSTADGPALHVYLVAAEDATTDAAVTKAGFLDLGPLKKGKSSQTFKVPANIDLWKYLAVTVWCAKFNVNFGTAPLASAKH